MIYSARPPLWPSNRLLAVDALLSRAGSGAGVATVSSAVLAFLYRLGERGQALVEGA